jgi:hypothetical protein
MLSRYKRELANANSYDEWLDIASAIETANGTAAWKVEERTRLYDYGELNNTKLPSPTRAVAVVHGARTGLLTTFYFLCPYCANASTNGVDTVFFYTGGVVVAGSNPAVPTNDRKSRLRAAFAFVSGRLITSLRLRPSAPSRRTSIGSACLK